MTTMLIVILS